MWEWEDGDEAARTGEEVPVDFDFFSFFAKPKVRNRLCPFDSSAGLLSPRAGWVNPRRFWVVGLYGSGDWIVYMECCC